MIRSSLIWLMMTAASAYAAAPSVAEIVQLIRDAALDGSECYRVRDLGFSKEDIRIYFNEGYLIFSKPVLGRRPWVVFSGDVEGGDAEIILIPPTRSERQSLAKFTQSPNLNEHLRSAFMVFTDGGGDELLEQVRNGESSRKATEASPLLMERWAPVVSNIAGPLQMRLIQDLLAPRTAANGLFFMALSGKMLGNFDVIFDAHANRRIAVRQRTERGPASVYDVWTSFPARSARNGAGAKATPDFTLSSYRIEADVDNEVHLKAATRVRVTVGPNPTRVFPLEIARNMRVASVRIDGAPAEVLMGDSPRGRISPRGEEVTFLTISSTELAAGSEHEFEFQHDGEIIATAGDGVYFVNARGSWYPHLSAGFATYDMTFRYPKRLTLVTAGELVAEREDGDWRVTQRRTDVPIEAAGFNLGDYEKVSGTAAGVALNVYGNRHLADSLKPKIVYVRPMAPPAPMGNPGRGPIPPRLAPEPVPVLQPPPDPLGRLKAIASDMTSALEYFSGLFGPPAMKTLTVAPIPGTFGQGFPGLVYLSTFAYIDPTERPAALRGAQQQVFFSDLIVTHEAAHQWWGGIVTVDRNEDEWLLEALANYSSLMWLERKKGFKEAAKVLESYRDELLTKDGEMESRESAGPIVWGERLQVSGSVDAWRTITYGKGAWIMHMLRRRLGDERFLAMLLELRKRFEFKPVTTEAFRSLVLEFRPKGMAPEVIETFFDNWVYATGLPSLKMRYAVKGAAPSVKLTGTLEQNNVDEDFAVDVPVEVQFGRGPSQILWVRTSGEAEPFEVNLKQAPSRVAISDGVLTRK